MAGGEQLLEQTQSEFWNEADGVLPCLDPGAWSRVERRGELSSSLALKHKKAFARIRGGRHSFAGPLSNRPRGLGCFFFFFFFFY